MRTARRRTAAASVAAVILTASAAAAFAAATPAAADPGDPQCLWYSELHFGAGGINAGVEDFCGGQVTLVLYRNGVPVRSLSGATGIYTVYPCNGTTATEWSLNTGLRSVFNCG